MSVRNAKVAIWSLFAAILAVSVVFRQAAFWLDANIRTRPELTVYSMPLRWIFCFIIGALTFYFLKLTITERRPATALVLGCAFLAFWLLMFAGRIAPFLSNVSAIAYQSRIPNDYAPLLFTSCLLAAFSARKRGGK